MQLPGGKVTLGIEARHFAYTFYAVQDGQTYHLGSGQTKFLSTEVAGNFTGVMFGLYAAGESRTFSTFTDFSLRCDENW